MTSTYPIDVEALIQRVQARAIELGEIPSRNRVMSEFKVGAPKAKSVLSALAEAGFDPTNPDTPIAPVPVRRLHSVPSSATEPEPVSGAVELEESEQVSTVAEPVPDSAPDNERSPEPNHVEWTESLTAPPAKRVRSWPLLLLAAGAFVSI
jgi:hypothetical protein